jgi:hypothetical protein
METKQLEPEVAAKYDVKGVSIGAHQFNGWGTIDLSALTVAQADRLYGAGFQWLVLKDVPVDNSAAAPTPEPEEKVVIPPVDGGKASKAKS